MSTAPFVFWRNTSGSANSLAYAGFTPTIYAAPADVGSGSGANEANAMDLPTALSAATAGDIIGCIPGTYTGTNTSDRFSPAWRTTNSGTSGNPIRVVAKYAAAIYTTDICDMRSGTTTDGAGCPAFGVNLKDYVEWIGFYVDEALSASRNDTGPVVCVATTGGAIRLCHIAGDTGYTPGDNHCGVRVEGTYNAVIADNKIHGFYNSTVSQANGTGIESYTSGNLTVENNTIYDCYTAIHHKANGDDPGSSGDTADAFKGWFVTRYNLCYDIQYFGLILARSYSGYDRDSYGNVLQLDVPSGQNGFGLTMWNYTTDDPRRNRIQNNVFYVSTTAGGGCYGIYHKNALEASNTFNGNIVVASTRAIYQEGMSTTFTTTYWSPDRNCYYGYTTFADLTNGNGGTLASYQSNYSGMDANAINSNPSFVDVSAHNFHLSGGSPCEDLARDVLNITGLGTNATIDAGAYPTGSETIGVRS